jgi:hypothetical protein
MTDSITSIVNQIDEQTKALAKAEGDQVLRVLRIARLFVKLKREAKPLQWQKEVRARGYDPRVVRRYLLLGASWLGSPETPEREIPQGLPYDMLKLEWLCRLSREQLASMREFIDVCKVSRTAVIEAVRRRLGEPQRAQSGAVKPNVQAIKKRCDDAVTRIFEAIDGLGHSAAEDEVRQQLAVDLAARFAEIEEALQAPRGAEADDSSETGEGGGTAREDATA